MRTLLAWTLAAAFLVTVPVTGGGRCPCQFTKAARTPTPAPTSLTPAPPPACKCCRPDTERTAPAHLGDGRQKPPPQPNGPADVPCDHCLVVDAAVAGPWGERPEATDGTGDAIPLVGETPSRPQPTSGSLAGEVGATLPRPGAHLIRYAHAFRC